MQLSLETIKVAVVCIKRANITGEEAASVVKALHELVAYADTLSPKLPPADAEDNDGDNPEFAE